MTLDAFAFHDQLWVLFSGAGSPTTIACEDTGETVTLSSVDADEVYSCALDRPLEAATLRLRIDAGGETHRGTVQLG
jgi:hypothetical protein